MKSSVHLTPRKLLVVIAALLVLTALSWGVTYLTMPPAAAVLVALAIAAGKVSLVVLFFMELIEHRGGVRVIAATAPVWVALLVLFMMADIWTR